MDKFREQVLKNSEVCARLNVSDYERRQMIKAGLLEQPIDTGARYPRHTLSQVVRAQNRLTELSNRSVRRSSSRKTKPLSAKMVQSLRAAESEGKGEKQ